MKNPKKSKKKKFDIDDLSEEDVKVPLSTLFIDKKNTVKIHNLADYYDIFTAIEGTVITFWAEDRTIRDKDVLSAYSSLRTNFDRQPDGTLASEIAKCVKANLLFRKQEGQKDYTSGEITSCLSKLITIAKNHRSPDGIGYLKWTKTFLEGKMPTDMESILEYMFTNEM